MTEQQPDDETILTPEDVAKFLCVSEKTLENWRGAGRGPTYRKLSRKAIRYLLADLRAFVASCRRTSTAER